MKKILAALLLLAMLCSMLAGCNNRDLPIEGVVNIDSDTTSAMADTGVALATPAESNGEATTVDYKAEYLDILKDYEKKYGMLHNRDDDRLGYVYGVCFAKLVDFDGNGTEEFVLIYREKDEGFFVSKVWTCTDNSVKEVENADVVFNFGTSVQPYISFFHKDGKVYGKDSIMEWGDPVMVTYEYITLQGDAMVREQVFTFGELETQIVQTSVNGVSVSEAEFRREFAPWDTEQHEDDYEYYNLDVWEDSEFEALQEALTQAKAALGY